MTGSPRLRVLLVVLLAAVLLPAFISACPLCKDAKSDADYAGGTASLPNGFNYSIFFMVAAPFVVIGAFALRVYLAARRRPAVERSPRPASAPPLLTDSGGARP